MGPAGPPGTSPQGARTQPVTGLWFGGACPSTVWHFGNLIDLPEPHAASLPLQTEIAKRLNTILAQIMPFLSQEVRGPLARSSGLAERPWPSGGQGRQPGAFHSRLWSTCSLTRVEGFPIPHVLFG